MIQLARVRPCASGCARPSGRISEQPVFEPIADGRARDTLPACRAPPLRPSLERSSGEDTLVFPCKSVGSCTWADYA